jgi:hypothetical protein
MTIWREGNLANEFHMAIKGMPPNTSSRVPEPYSATSRGGQRLAIGREGDVPNELNGVEDLQARIPLISNSGNGFYAR